MTTIDHRILIPAGPEAVWEYVSDITHNPDWQVDCAEVIFLTSRREGPGVRWRYSAPNGHECVIAVTAWYNGLGYEYYYVDGVPYKENKGRIRLQEIPEGTIVQWTFTYEMGGLFGGMRNSLGMSRSVDVTISESLKTLYQKIKASGAAARPHESKSLMRDAPNVDARSAYQPRHPSVMEEDSRTLAATRLPAEPRAPERRVPVEPPIGEGDGQRIRVIAEPPLAEDDTRRRKAAKLPLLEDSIPPDIEGEPDFLKQLVDLSRFEPPRAPAKVADKPDFLKQIVEPPVSPSDTQPRKAITPAEEAAPPVVPVTPAPSFDAPPVAPIAPVAPASSFEAPPSTGGTEPLALAAAPPFTKPEEPTAPAVESIDDTQADYAAPARIYEWPSRKTVEPEPAPQPETAQPTPMPEPLSPPTAQVAPLIKEALPALADPPVVVVTPEPAAPPEASETVAAQPKAVEPAPVVVVTPEPAPPVAPPQPAFQPKPASVTASIWEIFGVPRPSEIDAAAPAAPLASEPASDAPAAPEAVREPLAQPVVAETALPQRIVLPPAPARAGLRLALRRRLVDVRRP